MNDTTLKVTMNTTTDRNARCPYCENPMRREDHDSPAERNGRLRKLNWQGVSMLVGWLALLVWQGDGALLICGLLSAGVGVFLGRNMEQRKALGEDVD